MKLEDPALEEAEPVVYRRRQSERESASPMQPTAKPKAKVSRSETNAAKEALLARGLKILAQRQAESDGL